MKMVAILGGGPAGAFAAERLASAGLDTVVFDEKLAWEKPCGGGLTYKAYHTYPFLIENNTPKKIVTETILAAPRAKAATLRLSEPLLIYSRMDLNRMMLERAERAGARIEKARVLEINRTGTGWRLRTNAGALDADFCVIATGARNPLRDFGTQLTSRDSMSALGYYVPGDQAQIDIQFLPHLEGYIWIFPRCGHLSVGICGKGEPAASLRKRLENYMAQKGICWKGAAFYSHLLPSLETPAWKKNRVAGDGWLAVGDGAVAFRQVLERSGAWVPDDGAALHRASALAHCRLATGLEPQNPNDVRPEYLRLPDAELTLRAAVSKAKT